MCLQWALFENPHTRINRELRNVLGVAWWKIWAESDFDVLYLELLARAAATRRKLITLW